MKTTDIRQKSPKELDQLIQQTGSDLATVTLDLRTKQVKNVKAIHGLKLTLARVLTVKNEPRKVEASK